MTAPSSEFNGLAQVPKPVVLFSSRRGLLLAHASPALLAALGGLAVRDDGPHPISLALVFVGLALEAVSLFDFPTHASIGSDGVVRRCALRRQLMPWSQITDLRRAPGPRFRRVSAQPTAVYRAADRGRGWPGSSGGVGSPRGRKRLLTSDRSSRHSAGPSGFAGHSEQDLRARRGATRPAPGGLVAACGRRRYLLTDRCEGAEEFDAVAAGVAVWAPGVPVLALRPPLDWPPTWLYRRRSRTAP